MGMKFNICMRCGILYLHNRCPICNQLKDKDLREFHVEFNDKEIKGLKHIPPHTSVTVVGTYENTEEDRK